MSAASNKDYSSGEIMNLIHRDAGRVWSFVWDLSRIIECPFDLIIASYFLFKELGFTSLVTVVLYGGLWLINKYKSKLHRKTYRIIDKKRDKRMQMTSEAFNHAKMLKLYGWERNFENAITNLYLEEIELE